MKPIRRRQSRLNEFLPRFLGVAESERESQGAVRNRKGEWQIGNRTSNLSIEKVVSAIRSSKDAERFRLLYDEGDLTICDNDESLADYDLIRMIAFYTNGDYEQTCEILRASALARKKWDRDDYLPRTFANVLSKMSKFYSSNRNPPTELDRELAYLPRTDDGNAQRLKARYGKNLRFNHTRKKWMIWTGERWEYAEMNEVVECAKRTARSIQDEARSIPADIDADGKKDLSQRLAHRKHAEHSQSAHALKAMVEMLQSDSDVALTEKDLNRNPWLINVLNGTLNLRALQLTEHRREDLITSLIPSEWDPEAKCPTWLRFTKRVLPDKELRRYVQKAVGYSLTGKVADECLFFCYGDGSNGKTTFLNVLKLISAEHFARIPSDALMARRDGRSLSQISAIAGLAGMRIAVASELGEYDRFDEAMLKDITGRDPITARFLHRDFFTYEPRFKLWLCGNHQPRIIGTDIGIWRRLKPIPFIETIPDDEKDPRLFFKLKKELPGILAWAVRGTTLWREEGLEVPNVVIDALEAYRESQDEIKQFLAEMAESAKEDVRTPTREVFQAYLQWCKDHNERFSHNEAAFARRMAQHGYNKIKSSGKMFYCGIRLISPDLDYEALAGGYR